MFFCGFDTTRGGAKARRRRETEVWFSDGTYELIEDVTQFGSVPAILDTTSTTAPIEQDADTDHAWSGVSIYHKSSTLTSAPIYLQVIRTLAVPVDGEVGSIFVTGNLTKQNYFEDDLVDLKGVTVSGSYEELNNAAIGAANDDNPAYVHSDYKKYFRAEYRPIELNQSHLFRNSATTGPSNYKINQGSGVAIYDERGIDPNNKLIGIKIAGSELALPFANYYPIAGLRLNSINWGEKAYFQYVDYSSYDEEDWAKDVFNDAQMKLDVLYLGTAETKTIGFTEWERARLAGKASVIVPPNTMVADVETIMLRLGYYSKQPQMPGTQGPFTNQVIDVILPVYEFDGELEFVRKAGVHADIRVSVESVAPTSTAAGSAGLSAPNIYTQKSGVSTDDTLSYSNGRWSGDLKDWPPAELITDIARIYDLVAVYSRAGVRRDHPVNGLFYADAGSLPGNTDNSFDQPPVSGPPTPTQWGWWRPASIWNPPTATEIKEVDFTFRTPSQALLGVFESATDVVAAYTDGGTLDLKINDIDFTNAAVQRAFANKSATLEAVVVLPFHQM